MEMSKSSKPNHSNSSQARAKRREVVLTVGTPNYEERAFIRAAKAAGEPGATHGGGQRAMQRGPTSGDAPDWCMSACTRMAHHACLFMVRSALALPHEET